MMGIWFVATGFGGLLAGMIAKFANIPIHMTSAGQILSIYQQAFLNDAYIAFVTVLALLLFKKILRLRTHTY